MILGSFSFILNAMFLVVLSIKRDLVKKKRITYHVGNLAIVDALFGLSIFYIGLPKEVKISSTILKNVFFFMTNCPSAVSYSAVLLMAIERAVVIRKPFTWAEILPLKRILFAILVTWISSLLFLLTLHFKFPWLFLTFALLHLLIICLTIAVNIYIYNRLQIEKRRSMEILNNQEKAKVVKRKACALVLLIACMMAVTSLPLFLFTNLRLIHHTFDLKWSFLTRGCSWMIVWCLLRTIAYMNFVVNPVIYIWNDRMYRKAFCETFKINRFQ